MKRIMGTAVLIMTVILTLSSCTSAGDGKISVKSAYSILKTGKELSLESGFSPVADNGKYTLYANGDDLNIAVEENGTRLRFYTNHTDCENDEVALSDMLDLLKAQIKIDYYDSNGNFGSVNSYSDCVLDGQYTVNSVENGIEVIYNIGNTQSSVDDIPQKISDKRFRKFVQKLSKKKQTVMAKIYYKYYEDDGLWALTPKGKKNYRKILSLLKEAGYTEDDLAEDNSKYGISVKGNQRVYFKVKVRYILTDKGLSVSIPCKEIEYNSFYPPYEISLLPNFAAQRLSEDNKNGFILLPDGSGALMKFNSDVSPDYYYDAPVYGYDETVSMKNNTSGIIGSQVSLPIFGISNGNSSVAAYISDGAANASISAYRAGKNSSQFTVYPVFSVCNMDYVTLNGSDKASSTSVFQTDIYEGDFSVEYMISGGSYSEMANTFREYFLKNKIIKKLEKEQSSLPFYLETVGGAMGAKSVLGFSYSGVVCATSYEQNSKIVDLLSKNGVENIKLRLLGWCNKGMYPDCMSSISLISSLGGKSGFEKLKGYCKDNNIEIFPDAELLSGGLGSGESKSNVARTLDSRTVTTVERTYISSGYIRESAYAYSPSRILGISNRFLKSFKRLGVDSLSLADNGRVIYSDYNDTLDFQFDRATAQKYIERQTENLSKNANQIMIYGSNLYSVKYADFAVGVDNDDSWLLCEDCSVPLLQMILHGSVNLGSKPMNISQNDLFELLRCAEYGMAPCYRLSFAETSLLKDTEYSENFSSYYKSWYKTAAKNWSRLNKVLSDVQGTEMTEHTEISSNVFRTDYSNGISVYVNYSKDGVTVDGVNIPANDFVSKGVKSND